MHSRAHVLSYYSLSPELIVLIYYFFSTNFSLFLGFPGLSLIGLYFLLCSEWLLGDECECADSLGKEVPWMEGAVGTGAV